MKKSYLSMLILVFLTILVLVGCSSEGSETTDTGNAEESLRSDLQVAINAQPATLDPHISSAGITRDVGRNIYESVVALNSQYKAIPELAESIDVSDDNKEFVFNLRKGVSFHNGKEMKAQDVADSLNRWVESYGTIKPVVQNSRFEVVDDYTVKITLENGTLNFLAMIAGAKQLASIIPSEIIASAEANGIKEYIGTGPFKFEEWKTDQYIHLKKFEEYQSTNLPPDGLSGEKTVFIDNLYLQIVTDASTRLTGIQTNEYDLARSLSYDDFPVIERNSDLVVENELFGDQVLVLNKKQGLFSNVKMRQAVNAALDMDSILMGAASNEKFFRIGSSYMFNEQVDWFSEVGNESYNQKNADKAKQLLKEAGYSGEELVLLTSKEYPQFYNAAIVIQDQLENIGINVKLDVYDWATQQQRMLEPDKYDAFITSFSPTPTPSDLLYLSSAWAGWTEDDKITALKEEMNSAITQEEATEVWNELQAYLWEYLPVISFGDVYNLSAHSRKIENMNYFLGPIFWNIKVYK